MRYPTQTPSICSNQQTTRSHLSYDEQHAIWYVADFIIRCIIRRLKKSTYIDNYDDMIAMLEDFKENNTDDDNDIPEVTNHSDESIASNSTDWMRLIDRGLIMCNNSFYQFLCCDEDEPP